MLPSPASPRAGSAAHKRPTSRFPWHGERSQERAVARAQAVHAIQSAPLAAITACSQGQRGRVGAGLERNGAGRRCPPHVGRGEDLGAGSRGCRCGGPAPEAAHRCRGGAPRSLRLGGRRIRSVSRLVSGSLYIRVSAQLAPAAVAGGWFHRRALTCARARAHRRPAPNPPGSSSCRRHLARSLSPKSPRRACSRVRRGRPRAGGSRAVAAAAPHTPRAPATGCRRAETVSRGQRPTPLSRPRRPPATPHPRRCTAPAPAPRACATASPQRPPTPPRPNPRRPPSRSTRP